MNKGFLKTGFFSLKLFPYQTKRGCIRSQKTRGTRHPEFISGSDIQCDGILKQVQDDGVNDF